MAAEFHKNTHQTKPRSNACFLVRCFGISSEKESGKGVQSNDNSKKHFGWLSWSMFRTNKSGIKTVPIIDTTENIADHHQADTQLHTPKSKLKWLSYMLLINKRQKPITDNKLPFDEIHTVPKEIVEVTSAEKTAQNSTILEKQKSLEDTCQKRLSVRWRPDVKRTGSSQPGSPDVKPKRGRNSMLSQTVSLPAPNPPSQTRVKPKKTQQSNNVTVRKLNPLMGMSIIIVILIITLIWGRLCAIMCTSAWFYFISRFRNESITNEDRSNSGDLDLNSEEYKKKVVLEGFLERNHRTTAL